MQASPFQRSHAAWWLAAIAAGALGACQRQAAQSPQGNEACTSPATAIASIQGEGDASPMLGQAVRVRGIATHLAPDGVYIESSRPDASPQTSEGLFVKLPEPRGDVTRGSNVTVTGSVAEVGEAPDTLTALVDVTSLAVCGSVQNLPVTEQQLPLNARQRESVEGMHLAFRQALVVAGVYGLGHGYLRIAPDRLVPEPTEVARPGADAVDQAARNRASLLEVELPAPPAEAFPIGSALPGIAGVLGNAGRGPELLVDEDPTPAPPPLLPVQPAEPGSLRVVSTNLYNYFNGDGHGGGFPAERGDASAAEFAEHRHRFAAAMRQIGPQLVAVMELENDGFGPASAAGDVQRDLAEAVPGDWQAVDPGVGPIGTDAITVGLFYQAETLEPVETPQILLAPPFEHLSRVPLAVAFRHRASGTVFVVAVNHLKSKGGCPPSGPNANQGDGQGCWNPARVQAARASAAWTKAMAGRLADGRALVLGDLNAYRMEDPVQAFLAGGWQELTGSDAVGFDYSYVYKGEAGTLDHAFVSPALASAVRKAQVAHINAGFPPGLPLQEEWLRYSDHDPVVIDLRFNQAGTQD